MPDIYNMTVRKFLEFRIEIVREEISDLIFELEKIAHSSNELGFMSGRITELNYELMKLERYLEEYKLAEDENF